MRSAAFKRGRAVAEQVRVQAVDDLTDQVAQLETKPAADMVWFNQHERRHISDFVKLAYARWQLAELKRKAQRPTR